MADFLKGNVPIFDIFPNAGGDPISFNGGIAELYYYENVLSESVRMTISFADAGVGSPGVTASNAVKISRSEKVYVEIVDAYQQKISFTTDDNAMYIDARDKASDRMKEFEIIELVSKEYLKNESIRLEKRYDGKISDSIETILTEVLGTPKPLDIEPTSNERSFIGTLKKPFWFVMWLASQSIKEGTSALGLLAGFVFFETKSGYRFKSIDGLFEQNYTKKYIYTETESPPPPGYTGKIIRADVIDDADFKDQLQMGSFNSSVNLFNSQQSVFNCNPLNITQQTGAVSSRASEFGQNLNFEFIENPSRYFSSLESVGNYKSVPESRDLDFVKQDVLSPSASRYNQIFTVRIQVTIAADFSLEAGQLIFCDFPEQSSKPNPTYDPRISGVYLISGLCHRLSPTSQTYTSLELIRDAYGRIAE